MSEILKNFINDVIDEIAEEYNLIFGKTKEEVNSVKESFKYLFTGFTIFTGFIITLIGSTLIDLSTGTIILFLDLVTVLLLLLKRQQKIRKLHDVYGEYISILGQKKSAFIKIRKQINYWEHARSDYVITKDDYLTSKNIRNTLHALDIIDHGYGLYKIGIYEKLFHIVQMDTKSTIFWALMHHIKNSINTVKELVDITAKPIPFYIHNEINRILDENKKYVPQYFKEPSAVPNYEVYINSNDYVDVYHDGGWKLLKKLGLRKYSNYIQEIKPYEFLLDENLNIIKKRLKN